MARPNQPRDMKPQSEDRAQAVAHNASIGRIISINVVTGILLCAAMFILNTMTVQKFSSKIEQLSLTNANTEDSAEANESIERGLIVDMGDFTLNLADVNPRRYLKANVALELSKTANDRATLNAKPEPSGGHGHGHGAAETVDPLKTIEEEMNQFKPAIRDAIITTLSSKTSEELATVPGKELAKEQITEAVDAIFNGEREVMRVSFGQFIMQ